MTSPSDPQDATPFGVCLPGDARRAFVAAALAARGEALQSGEGFAAEEVHAYLRARALGRAAQRPSATPWRGVDRAA